MRNYRSDTGKWQTSDPLGYPDGWNNYAYCNNGVTLHFDYCGGKIGDGIWEWESSGPDDDQRCELIDEYYIGGGYNIIKSWKELTDYNFTIGSAYAAETRAFSSTITVGCTGGLNIAGVGISISDSHALTSTHSYSTAKGEKAN